MGRKRIYKSRYDSIDCFISDSPLLQDKYNDLPLVHDEDVVKTLLSNGTSPRCRTPRCLKLSVEGCCCACRC